MRIIGNVFRIVLGLTGLLSCYCAHQYDTDRIEIDDDTYIKSEYIKIVDDTYIKRDDIINASQELHGELTIYSEESPNNYVESRKIDHTGSFIELVPDFYLNMMYLVDVDSLAEAVALKGLNIKEGKYRYLNFLIKSAQDTSFNDSETTVYSVKNLEFDGTECIATFFIPLKENCQIETVFFYTDYNADSIAYCIVDANSDGMKKEMKNTDLGEAYDFYTIYSAIYETKATFHLPDINDSAVINVKRYHEELVDALIEQLEERLGIRTSIDHE